MKFAPHTAPTFRLATQNRAVQIDRSPENLISLATGLTYRAGGKLGSTADQKTALGLAEEAAQMNHDPEDESYDATVAQLALGLDDRVSFRQSLDTLSRKYPRAVATHYFAAVDAAIDEHWEKAEDEIREAERLGLPSETAKNFLATGVHSRATAWRYARYTMYGLIVWAVGLLLLFAAGRALSLRTLSSIERVDPNVLASDFRRISHGAVRLQEVLADRMAAHLYGPAAFEQGLRHVIARSVEFDAAVTMELQSAANARRSVSNLYALPPLPPVSSKNVEHRIADAMSRPTTEDDTHPGPSDRVRLIQRVSHNGDRSDSTPVWDLFSSPHHLMTEMTALVAGQIRNASATAG